MIYVMNRVVPKHQVRAEGTWLRISDQSGPTLNIQAQEGQFNKCSLEFSEDEVEELAAACNAVLKSWRKRLRRLKAALPELQTVST